MRPVTESDIPTVAKLYGDPELTQYFEDGKPKSYEKVALYVREMGICRFESGNPFGVFSVVENETGKLMGQCDILPYDGNEAVIEIAYIIFKEFQGRGFGSEIAQAAKEYVEQSERRVEKLVATAHPENKPSWKILEKLGMVCTKEFEKFGQTRKFYELKIGH
ncbi:MAG: GNAT family N-acetyltransferase [Chlamydiia bacterium]|nr:GNAT family N-acetyltransferase [Chlamydiia bacterium]